jgi:hypothetical protein
MLVTFKKGPSKDPRRTLRAKQPWLDADVSRATWFKRKKRLMQQQEDERK